MGFQKSKFVGLYEYMAKKMSRTELEATINTLKGELTLKDSQHTQEIANAKAVSTAEKVALQIQIDNAKVETDRLEAEVEEKQNQLNDRELKKLAQAYKDQESEYQLDAEKWFGYSIKSFVIVGASFALTLWLGEGKLWYDKIEYHIINILTVTALVFSLSQFSRFNKLRIDFANRKAMAQAYHNIFTSVDDLVIKDRFLDEAIDVLCARPDQKPDANTLPEKLIESITEIAKNLSKK
ncbi:MAG: hypothetical protein A2842_02445 [Candidatus Wildermuthbacteria bacterium RIFCSPHIGHO2_01_FULL_48_25]|nr:MAG: hypothetical protein A2842_02445 [Candidatus Wildermuthbacteria bacterium RIFCSPHIGHO2_01_FULL_48_25]